MMKSKQVVQSGDKIDKVAASQKEADALLLEIGRLYRERFRAMYNGDQPTLKSVTDQIAQLKTKLTQL